MRKTLLLTIVLASATLLYAGESVPLGHPDFYPSPERPLGWRGDGTGAWPGANIVTSWDAATGKNIAWKVNTPGAGLCQPLVVGEKVFITADPNLLCCYSIQDGRLLWQTAIDHTLSMPAEDREKARAEQAYFDALWLQYQRWVQGFSALLDALAAKQGMVEPPAPANPKDKEYQTKRDAWQRARRELLATVLQPGSSGFGAYLPKRDDPKGIELLRLLGGATELQERYAALLAEQELHYWRPECGSGGNRTRFDYKAKPDPAWMVRYKASNSKYDIWFTVPNNWIAWVTYSFSTPITDGKYIYAATANNAVAAVDLEGKIVWQVWEYLPGFKNNLGTAYTTSPVLMDGKLVVYHRNHVRAYEAATGKKLWQHVDPNAVHGAHAKKGSPSNYNWRCPEGSSPNVTRLKLPDGSLMPVVLDGSHLMWRLEDGAMVCNTLPDHWKGNTSITHDDVYLLVHGSDGKPEYSGAGVRLKAESRDKVTWEWLWKEPDAMCHSLTPVLMGDRFIGRFSNGRQPSVTHHMLTGKTQPIFGGKPVGGNTSPIVAGNKFLVFNWTDGGSLGSCSIGDLVSGEVVSVPVAVKDERLSGTDEFALIHRNTMCGYQQNSSPSAQANRIFFRARGVLWCIGDPKQPFPVPRNCPAAARVNH